MDDRSIGKETRGFAPFLDLLDLHELVMVQENSGSALRSALPGRMAAGSPGPVAADDAVAAFSAKLGALPNTPPVLETDVDAAAIKVPAMSSALAPQAPPLQMSGVNAAHDTAMAKAGSAAANHAGQAAREHSHAAPDKGGSETHLDGIRVRIDQDADIDQDIDADVSIRADHADVSIRTTADADIEQDAAVMIRAGIMRNAATAADRDDDVSIVGRQSIDIDTIVRVDVSGYVGEVVVTTALSEEADVDQRMRAIFRADAGDEVFDIDISQFLDVDLLSDIDIDIHQHDGRLYMNLSIRDVAQGEDVIRLDVTESADDVLDLDLKQLAEVTHRVAIDLDIEQELANLFDIDVDFDADINVVVRQEAEVDANLGADGSADWEADGESEIAIENQLRIRIDFGAV